MMSQQLPRPRSTVHFGLAIFVGAAFAMAAVAAAQQPPPGTASLLDAETEMTQSIAKYGWRTGLVPRMLGYSVLFDPHAVPALEWLKDHVGPEGPFEARPEQIEIGAPGDLGYVVSRWERRNKDGKTTGSGHQVTMWKWWPKANWKLLALIATNDPSPADSSAMRALRHETGSMMSHDAVEAANQTLLEADRGLASAAAALGWEKAFEARAGVDVLLLRAGLPPARGKEAAVAVLRTTPGRWSCEPRASRSSGSGDLGYTYGQATLRTDSKGADSLATSSYLRVWRKSAAGTLEIAVDVALPMPPRPAE